MKRLELFEFEDYNWLPKDIRTGATNLIMVLHRMVGTADVLSNLILKVKSKIAFSQIVDLGSGSGGPMLETIQKVNEKLPGDAQLSLILSDLYPNSKAIGNVDQLNIPNTKYHPESLNAVQLDKAPKGLKTMIASFHHMPPKVAKEILEKAEKSGEPLLIYEIAQNNIPVLLWWLLLPVSLLILIVMSLCMTPFVKPLRFQQLLFTYIIPVIPLVYAWDGQASLMRTYTFDDIKELLGNRTNSKYTWEIANALKENGKKAGYYILGYPTVN